MTRFFTLWRVHDMTNFGSDKLFDEHFDAMERFDNMTHFFTFPYTLFDLMTNFLTRFLSS